MRCTAHGKKLAAAIEYLGTAYVLHPDYCAAAHPQHSLRFRHSARLAAFRIAIQYTRGSAFKTLRASESLNGACP